MVTRGRGTINQPGQSRSTSQAASGSGIQTLPVGAVFHGSCKLLQKARSEQASSFHDKLHVDMVSDARLRHPIIFQSSNPGPIQPSSQASSELSSSQAIQVPSSLPVRHPANYHPVRQSRSHPAVRHPANYLPSRSHPAFQCWRSAQKKSHLAECVGSRPSQAQESSELSSSQAIQVPSSLPVLAAHSAKGESHLAECAGSSPQQSQAT